MARAEQSPRRATVVDGMTVRVFTFPTSSPESDGTLDWDHTTAVCVEVTSDDASGLGWTYSSPVAASLIREHLLSLVVGKPAAEISALWELMRARCRNLGVRGLVMQAISAVDIALWDLKARLFDVSVTDLLGRSTDRVRVYGSGGFTSQSEGELTAQLQGWISSGMTAVKIKIGEAWGTAVERDVERLAHARRTLPDGVELMADANGGYHVGQARRVANLLDPLGVCWFEEPVSSDDLAGLDIVRRSCRCDVTAGEYASDLYDVRRLCGVIDCLQLDATRCGGYTGLLKGAAIASSHNLEVSTHCAPSLHVPVAAALPNLRHVEWFSDHAELEPLLVTNCAEVHGGYARVVDLPGHGMTLADTALAHEVAS